jgi:5-deoxy-glucuronate isomerase
MVRSPLISGRCASGRTGYLPIVESGDPEGPGLDFGLHTLERGESFVHVSAKEACWLLLGGHARVQAGQENATLIRGSLFDEAPSAALVPPGCPLEVEALEPTEWARLEVANANPFRPLFVRPHTVRTERRGAGLMQEAATRIVRQLFERSDRPESKLVVGEVVNFPGRWSSYPPHHHDQPEIYHYRFTEPQGYGHAELGNDVYKVRSHDTLVIRGGFDHAQVSAPGYGMYYLWVVRHLPAQPYEGFTYAPDHTWMLDPRQPGWEPPP